MWNKELPTGKTNALLSSYIGLHSAEITWDCACSSREKVPPSRPQQGCHLPNSHWPGIIQSFLARESLVSDIPAEDGKTANLFLQCMII